MALIPSEPRKQVALLVGIAAIALTYAFFQYWYTPRVEEVERLESRLEVLQDQNRRAQVLAARGGPELEERLAVYERHLNRMEELIPRSGEVPALLNTITAEANRFGVVLGSLRPEPLIEEEFYTRESYQMQVAGDYHQVGQFLTSIASLPRIITTVDLEVFPYTGTIPPRDSRNPIFASFRIQTYRSPPRNDSSLDLLQEQGP
jgi:type IV pilus assembly protein PilO